MRKTQGKLEQRNRNIRKSQKKGIETMRKTIDNIGKYLEKRERKPLERTFKTQGEQQNKMNGNYQRKI